MKKLIALVLVFCMAIILVPALAESADVAGEWVCSFAGHTIPLTINADGTFSMNGAEGTWILDGETLSMTAQEQTIVFIFKGDVISVEQQGQTLEFTRAAAEEAAPAEKETPVEEEAPAEKQTVEVTFADVNPAAVPEDFNGEWCIQYIAAGDEFAANETGEVTADIAIKDSGITFGSSSGFSEFFGDKALKMEYADGTFSYSRSFFGISLSFEIKMLQDGMVAVTIDIDGNVATLYMIRVDVATKEPAA